MTGQRPQYAFIAGIPEIIVLTPFVFILVAVVGRILRYARELDAERRRLRIEVAKLGHELEQWRKEVR